MEKSSQKTAIDARNRNVQSVKNFLHYLEQKDMQRWNDLWADDANHYYPYHSGMFPPVMKGKKEIIEYWKGVPDLFDSLSFPILEIYSGDDPNVVVIRFNSHNIMKGGVGEYNNTYVNIYKFDDEGKIKDYWEYFNPITTGVTYGLITVKKIETSSGSAK